ncbi:hypothetical protein [Actinoplanes sp. N902-109]|uniref:hypothetical protein n=1 Tax=Actinoplanes sp. (strain N902-109) TaxID=649831 RepID=UPI0003293E9B|nr:hypothetical protein [Actinoplanes sp. N902-109]AGL13846.1 hypothetical protein L083_0336 [Actinoplanes sp. N902-109]
MTGPDIDAGREILDRSERAYAWIRERTHGQQLPGFVRQHFNLDVPSALGSLRAAGIMLDGAKVHTDSLTRELEQARQATGRAREELAAQQRRTGRAMRFVGDHAARAREIAQRWHEEPGAFPDGAASVLRMIVDLLVDDPRPGHAVGLDEAEQILTQHDAAAERLHISRATHDAVCTVRVATLQEFGPHAGLLHCAACGFFYPPITPGADTTDQPGGDSRG